MLRGGIAERLGARRRETPSRLTVSHVVSYLRFENYFYFWKNEKRKNNKGPSWKPLWGTWDQLLDWKYHWGIPRVIKENKNIPGSKPPLRRPGKENGLKTSFRPICASFKKKEKIRKEKKQNSMARRSNPPTHKILWFLQVFKGNKRT